VAKDKEKKVEPDDPVMRKPGGERNRKKDEVKKPQEVVFLGGGPVAKMVPVKSGISDENYTEILDGLQEGQPVISGSYKAIMRDLEDGKKIVLDDAKAKAQEKPTP